MPGVTHPYAVVKMSGPIPAPSKGYEHQMKHTHSMAIAAIAILPVLLAGCGKSDDAATSHSTTTAITTAITSPAPMPPVPLPDLDCGQITGKNGATAHVIAFANEAGRAGCGDAITVVSDYVGAARADTAGTVDGWYCQPQPDSDIPHVCTNEGLVVGLRGDAAPTSPPPPAPSPVHTPAPGRTPQPAPANEPPAPAAAPATTVGDSDCGPVVDAGGASRGVIAVATSAGRVGCVEAIDVATAYTTTISPSDAVTVNGWRCHAQSDTAVPEVCEKDGLRIGLRAP